MPAEWEPHDATWLAWPHNVDDWPGKFAAIPFVYADIVRHLHISERVCILVQDEGHEKRARRILLRCGVNLSNIQFYRFTTDRVWVRDSGPIFVIRNEGQTQQLAVTNWKFNAWAKYPNWHNDDKLPELIGKELRLHVFTPLHGTPARQIVLEGGSIDVNGAGLMLTTEECLLSEIQQRNPGVSREELEQIFADYLGVGQVIWLKEGIEGDDTHGHVDDLARFTDENTIVIATEENKNDGNYERLRENMRILKKTRGLNGEKLRIIPLPMPCPVIFDGQRLPASYANFYIANTVVLVPTFNDPNDRVALNTLQKLFSTRKVIGIHSLDLVWGLGTLHCMTQQQPSLPNVNH